MQRKHDRKKRSSAVMWSFVLTLALIAAVAAILGIFQKPEEPPADPVPVGTPAQAPTVDQRPVPPASSVPAASSAPPAAGAPVQTPAASAPAQDGASSVPAGSQPSAPENAGQPAPAIDAKDGEQVVRGVIVDATTSSVTIQTADGTQLSFMRETADVTGRLVIDAEAEVYYVGSISGTDTSAAFVTKIVAFA